MNYETFTGTYFLFVFIMCFASLAITIFIVHLHSRANAVPPSTIPPTVSSRVLRLSTSEYLYAHNTVTTIRG